MAEFSEEIFTISKDPARARDLVAMAKERLDLVIKAIPQQLIYKILEEYYEAALQMITARMYLDGFKTLSHVAAIQYLKKYPALTPQEIEILDKMRKFRHGIIYYGKKESGNFFLNHEQDIKLIIRKLIKLNEKDGDLLK